METFFVFKLQFVTPRQKYYKLPVFIWIIFWWWNHEVLNSTNEVSWYNRKKCLVQRLFQRTITLSTTYSLVYVYLSQSVVSTTKTPHTHTTWITAYTFTCRQIINDFALDFSSLSRITHFENFTIWILKSTSTVGVTNTCVQARLRFIGLYWPNPIQ